MSSINAGGGGLQNPSDIFNPSGGGPPPYSPSLDFSDARNSQYIALLIILGFL
jgi:hypothetical protein